MSNFLNWIDRSWVARTLEPLLWPALLTLMAYRFAPTPFLVVAALFLIAYLAFMIVASAHDALQARAIRSARQETLPTLQRVQDYHRDDESLLAEQWEAEKTPLPAPPDLLGKIIYSLGHPMPQVARVPIILLFALISMLAFLNANSIDLAAWLTSRAAASGLVWPSMSRWELAMLLTASVFFYYLWIWASRTRSEMEARGTV